MNAPLELHRVQDDCWVIHDKSFPPDDTRHLVASVHEVDACHVEVVWMQRIPLALRYASATDVLDDLIRWRSGAHGGTRPIAIPHLQPRRTAPLDKRAS